MEIKDILQKLKNAFSGEPWFGDSMLEILGKIDFEMANRKAFGDQRSVHRLVLHIISWREFVIQKLAGNDDFEIEMDGEMDWPTKIPPGENGWKLTLSKLQESQNHFVQLLENQEDESILRKKVPGRKYNFEFLLEGVIQHDIYHLGQIGLLKNVG